MTSMPSHVTRLAEVLAGLPVEIGLAPEQAALPVTGLCLDSRAVTAGNLFFALPGGSGHGLAHADDARRRGALAVVCEPAGWTGPLGSAIAIPDLKAHLGGIADRFYRRPSAQMVVIGVTGTNGKTSTVQLLAGALDRDGQGAASIGTLGAGRPGALRAGERTTPDVLSVHRLLAELHAEGAASVAMEVSSHALDQGRVDDVRFRVAVFTNLSRDHLDYHGSMAAYGAAKARLFDWPGLAAAVINLDDPFGVELHARMAAGPERIGVSVEGDPRSRVRAERLRLDDQGIGFDLIVEGRACPVRSRLLGRFNVDNLLAVAGALHALGWPVEAIAARLTMASPVPGRMQPIIGAAGRPAVVVDYAHTPDALEKLLIGLRRHTEGRLLCLFGCGGERDPGKRPQMAAIAERLADGLWISDDNPRSEDGDAIVADILAGLADRARARVQRDRAAAIAEIIAEARPGDLVAIAGKGHETYQDVAGVRRPFDDAAVAAQALEGWR